MVYHILFAYFIVESLIFCVNWVKLVFIARSNESKNERSTEHGKSFATAVIYVLINIYLRNMWTRAGFCRFQIQICWFAIHLTSDLVQIEVLCIVKTNENHSQKPVNL